jgi:DNA-binding CsgD family transcriptional regulator
MMPEAKLLPWRKMWDFVSICSQQNDLHTMFKTATREISHLLPCEQATANYFEVLPGKSDIPVFLEHCNMPDSAVRLYREYYFYKDVVRLRAPPGTVLLQVNWKSREYSKSEISQDYVIPIFGIGMSAGIPFVDPDGKAAMCFTISRTGSKNISEREESIFLALRPHIVNLFSLHWRMQTLSQEHFFAAELACESELLSKREAEIAGFLCKRLLAHEIATLLMISKRTVETHVQQIYFKLSVNNRRELLQKLLGQQ